MTKFPPRIGSRLVALATFLMYVPGSAIVSSALDVCACVEEIPGEGGCSFIGTAVTLEPLGLQGFGPRSASMMSPPGTTPSRHRAVRTLSDALGQPA